MSKKTLKYSVTGASHDIPVGKRKAKPIPADKGMNITAMLERPKESDLIDFMVLMEDFKKTPAYRYLLERNTNELKRLIRVGPQAGENWDTLGGKLQGMLDSFEGAIKGVIINGQKLKERKKAESNLKKQEKEFEGIDNRII